MEDRKMAAHHCEAANEAENGSDRVCAIVLGAAVQDFLQDALAAALIQRNEHSSRLLSPDGPLGNWGLMNDLAHSIGLIDDEVWNDLDCLRRIRNKFAHWSTTFDSQGRPQSITFTTDQTTNLARNLKCPEIHPPLDFGPGEFEDFVFPEGGVDKIPRLPPPTNPRERFVLTCKCLIHLCGRINIHFRDDKAIRKTFDFQVLNERAGP